jgi:hypothetical protein
MDCLFSSCLHQARLVSCYMISRLVLRICFRLVGSNSNCFIGNVTVLFTIEDFDLSIYMFVEEVRSNVMLCV